LDLRPRESGPEGFVWVPSFQASIGFDLRANGAEEPAIVGEGGFWMADTEVTNQEWFDFVNDGSEGNPYGSDLAFQARMEERQLAVRIENRWMPIVQGGRATPSSEAQVFGAAARGMNPADVEAFLAWKNRRAEAAGAPYRFDLPTPREWEAVARGADRRSFPWGNRFDYSLTVGAFTAFLPMGDAPARTCPTDESPFGVADMAGSAMEFTRQATAEGLSYFLCGSSHKTSLRDTFLLASRRPFHVIAGVLQPDFWGLRLVARPRPGGDRGS
jgi:formylglycine-generating enzyme required for sulfatase activity